MTLNQAIEAALASINAGDIAKARRILDAANHPADEDLLEDCEDCEDCDASKDFPPDSRFDGIPRNWMGEPC